MQSLRDYQARATEAVRQHWHNGVRRVLLTTMQGISGAGRAGGVLALDIIDNLVPYIPKEEEKVSTEAGKILGRLVEGGGRLVEKQEGGCMQQRARHAKALLLAERQHPVPVRLFV